MRGKLIVLEGLDSSGKATQSRELLKKLRSNGHRCEEFSFPNYNSPTGKIVGGPFLGREDIGEGWFKEGAPSVDSKVSSLYYAADRKYNIHKIELLLENGVNVILDRYTYSNMAYQGGKITDKQKRYELYKWIEKLELDLLELPKPDIALYIYVPLENMLELIKERINLDQNEKDLNTLRLAETAYHELATLYDWKTINCVYDNKMRTISDISEEIYDYIISKIES